MVEGVAAIFQKGCIGVLVRFGPLDRSFVLDGWLMAGLRDNGIATIVSSLSVFRDGMELRITVKIEGIRKRISRSRRMQCTLKDLPELSLSNTKL